MIQDWRNRWGQGDFPFLFVQLANYKSNGCWPVLRESQTETLRLANTGMAVTIDIGESKDIHPKNKQDVGLRLALAARAMAYKQPVEYSGPLFQIGDAGGRRRCACTSRTPTACRRAAAARSRASRSRAPTASTCPAEAKVEGNTMLVIERRRWRVRRRCATRGRTIPVCNLVNQAGLPASPFRSDSRHGMAGRWPRMSPAVLSWVRP